MVRLSTDTTNQMNATALTKQLGFAVTITDGIAWPHTGAAGKSITAKIRAERLAKIAAATGRPVIADLYVRL
jgi:hypothetical protein